MPAERTETWFWDRVDKSGPIHPKLGPCWEWKGTRTPKGYGVFGVNGRGVKVHAFSWYLRHGPIPKDGLVFDHLCRNRLCVNPSHLERVTNRTNVLRGEGLAAQCARKTHCKRGHEFSEENIYREPSNPTKRTCKVCKVARFAEWSSRRRRRKPETPDA